MTEGLRVAVAGASGLVGEATIEALAESRSGVAQLLPLASGRSLGRTVPFAGRQLPLGLLADFDFAAADLALFAVDPETAGEHVPRALAAGCRVIDASSRFHDEAGVPLWLPGAGVPPAGVIDARLIALPGPAAAMLAGALAPLHAAVGLVRVDVVLLEAASGAGRAGVEELAQQSAMLLNGRPASKASAFPRPLAFNCLPEVGGIVPGEPSGEERAIVLQLHRLLGADSLAVGVTAVQVPVFHGHSAAVHLRLARELDADQARALLRKAPGIKVIDEARGARYPTAAADAVGAAQVLVGRIRSDPSRERGLALWVVADNIRTVAANRLADAVQILVNRAT